MREMQWTQDIVGKAFPCVCQRTHEMKVRSPINAKRCSGSLRRTFEDNCTAIVEWMRKRSWRIDPLDSMGGQVKRLKERRSDSHRMNG
jgi:hypothetical protein